MVFPCRLLHCALCIAHSIYVRIAHCTCTCTVCYFIYKCNQHLLFGFIESWTHCLQLKVDKNSRKSNTTVFCIDLISKQSILCVNECLCVFELTWNFCLVDICLSVCAILILNQTPCAFRSGKIICWLKQMDSIRVSRSKYANAVCIYAHLAACFPLDFFCLFFRFDQILNLEFLKVCHCNAEAAVSSCGF